MAQVRFHELEEQKTELVKKMETLTSLIKRATAQKTKAQENLDEATNNKEPAVIVEDAQGELEHAKKKVSMFRKQLADMQGEEFYPVRDEMESLTVSKQLQL